MTRPIVRDSAASTVGVLLQGGARFAVSIMIGRLAGHVALASVNGALALAAVASLLWPTSSGQAASIVLAREEAAGRSELVPAVQRHLTRRTAAAVLVTLPGVVAAGLLLLGVDLSAAMWGGAVTAAFSAYNFVRGVQFGRGRILRATGWEAVSAVTTLALLAAVLLADWSGLYLLPLTVGYGIYAIGGWPRAGAGRSELPRALRRELDHYVAWGVVGTVASTGMLHLSMIIAVASEDGRDAGMYAAAISVATPAAMLATAFSMALAPTMARSVGRADPHGLAAQTDAATRSLVAGMTLVFGSVFIAAPMVVGLLYGEEYADAVLLVRILLVAVLASTLPIAAVNSMTAQGSRGVRTAAVMASASLVLGLAFMVLLASVAGVVGVAVGFLIGALVKALLLLGFVWRRDRLRWAGLAARAVLGAVGMSGVLLIEPAGVASRVGYALVFGAVWSALSYRDVAGQKK